MILLRKLLGVTVLSLSASLALAADSASLSARQTWHQHILLGYQALATEALDLHESAKRYCQQGDRDVALKQHWQDAFLAWQRVRFVDFGPVENDNLGWQFQFWPDPKNLVARKASGLLKANQAITADTVDISGVVVQGFPMAEYLLFDERLAAGQNALPAERSCALLTAVTAHILGNSNELRDNWQALKPHYLSTETYTDASIRAGMTAVEILEERRLATAMGLRGNGKRSVYAADAWRSGTSLLAIEASVEGLRDYYLPGLKVLLKAAAKPALIERLQTQTEEVLAHFPALSVPMAPVLASDERFGELQGLYVDIDGLNALINDQAAVALGIVRGFNSSDGD